MKATNALISDICSQTQNPSLCLQALNSDPRSATTADLKGLARISIDITQTNAKQTSDLIASLSKGATSPILKGRYDTCAENYDDAVADLDDASKALDSGDIGTLRIKASAASDGPETCEDSFEGPPAEPSQLQQANKKVEGLCSIILVIGSRLQSRSK
ncbi:hypothetical protein U1Q18_015906 [Sarracenia purpurea var. burkii]